MLSSEPSTNYFLYHPDSYCFIAISYSNKFAYNYLNNTQLRNNSKPDFMFSRKNLGGITCQAYQYSFASIKLYVGRSHSVLTASRCWFLPKPKSSGEMPRNLWLRNQDSNLKKLSLQKLFRVCLSNTHGKWNLLWIVFF